MLPSLGYFRGITCPDETTGKKCLRPYCHFRHTKLHTDSESEMPTINLEVVQKAISQLKSDVSQHSKSASTFNSSYFQGEVSHPYEPESLSDETDTQETFETSQGGDEDNAKSAYSGDHKGYTPARSGSSKQKKNITYSAYTPAKPTTDLEYDPLSNYNCKDIQMKSRVQSNNSPKDNEPEFSDSDKDDLELVILEDNQEETLKPVTPQYEPATDSEKEVPDKHQETVIKAVIKPEADIIKPKPEDIKPQTGDNKSQSDEIILRSKDPTLQKHKTEKSATKSKHVAKVPDKISKVKSKSRKESSLPKKLKTAVKTEKSKERLKKEVISAKQGKILSKEKKIVKKPNVSPLKSPTKISAETIKKFVDEDEIKRLDKELNGINTFEECYRIYQEDDGDLDTSSADPKDSSESDAQFETTVEDDEASSAKKFSSTLFKASRRVALKPENESAAAPARPVTRRARHMTPAQKMMQRFETIKIERSISTLNQLTTPKPKKPNPFTKRIIAEKKQPFKDIYRSSTSSTMQQTAGKGIRRLAHATSNNSISSDSIARPVITPDRHCKVPTNIRQRYLTMFIDECLRINKKDRADAYKMAEVEELRCKERSKTKSIYLSLAASTLKRLRDTESSTKTQTTSAARTKTSTETVVMKGKNKRVAHGSVDLPNLSTKKQKLGPSSNQRKISTNLQSCKGGYEFEMNETTRLSGEELYERMCNYILTEEQLKENGFPREGDVPGQCRFYKQTTNVVNTNAKRKICQRCGKEFVMSNLSLQEESECIHHWGRAYPTKVGSSWEKRYACCQNTLGSEGCSVAETHVHQDNKLDCTGYVKTLVKSPNENETPGIFALDCEMCYTTVGLELARVSVVNFSGNLVYDSFVLPEGKILDYNTRWSGLRKSDFKGVKTTLRHIQAVFLSKFSTDSILIGHSLESDLVALRIIHNSIVDTSVIFPHRLGPPYKRALRNLMSEYLGIVIQNAGDEGHDCTEDAVACVKLMNWKLNEDCKVSK